jgi:hypothetical protein
MERLSISPGSREKPKAWEVNALETSRTNGTGSAIRWSVRPAISIFLNPNCNPAASQQSDALVAALTISGNHQPINCDVL